MGEEGAAPDGAPVVTKSVRCWRCAGTGESKSDFGLATIKCMVCKGVGWLELEDEDRRPIATHKFDDLREEAAADPRRRARVEEYKREAIDDLEVFAVEQAANELRDDKGNFLGFAKNECGEHRTVGPHRAWCFQDSEWCSPAAPCRGCELPALRSDNADLPLLRAEIHRLMPGAVVEYDTTPLLERIRERLGEADE